LAAINLTGVLGLRLSSTSGRPDLWVICQATGYTGQLIPFVDECVDGR